ncbi:tRNA (adenine(22)-N(1))-methyltransferase [Aquibacillus rhizosphaerae]|uniref:tRNA (Adenine(22)-N(1))-methyltransferase TrmK n=1 Tax=Aquibacillus rhizosphaerae TaxID=3051431 RepID=A0ABT7L6N4_9BACI|nr:tRNA (adenine(22)-N(1))-methyltransferase TrmK [Aquibacillus sp. LR5S19]MDL4841518.1 tRNA (adenine(22)-N(1))-methyltransferase TrmK [Aquibacillus sp. LR5S19]
MNKKNISERLQLVASFLPKRAFFADIGSDHAYLPCFVCINDKYAKAIAGEINEGPYQSAKRTVEELKLQEQIEVRKGNGLAVIKETEVSHVVIAGMGGSLISTILAEGKANLKKVERIIAQPNVDADTVRKWFFNNNYHLVDEKIIKEDGRIYEVLVGIRGNAGESPYTKENLDRELLFGPFLLREKTEPFKEKWRSELEKKLLALEQIKKAKILDENKINQFKSEIAAIEEVL